MNFYKILDRLVGVMEKVAVIVDTKIVDNYFEGSKKPFCWDLTLNYLDDLYIKSAQVKYYGDKTYCLGNIVLYNLDNGEVNDIEKLSSIDIQELEVVKQFYVSELRKTENKLNVTDSKIDTIEEKLDKHMMRVNAGFQMSSLSRIIDKMNDDITNKGNRKQK